MSAADPLSYVLDDVLSLDKILSTDGRVLIIDQICLVILDPRWFPDDVQVWECMEIAEVEEQEAQGQGYKAPPRGP